MGNILLHPWCVWPRHGWLVEVAACDLKQCWQRISGTLTKQTDTWSVHCYIEYRYKNRYLLYCVVLCSNRLLKGMEDKVLFPIMVHQSGSVGNIQVKMGGWGGKRKIKGNLTTFITQREREKSPNIICSITKCFVSTVCTRNTGSSFSRFNSAYMNLKFWNEHTEYFICIFLSQNKLAFTLLVQIYYSPSPRAPDQVERANLVFLSFYNHHILYSKLHYLVYYRRGL